MQRNQLIVYAGESSVSGGDGEKIASSPLVQTSSELRLRRLREKERKKNTSKDPPATRSTAGSLRCVWWIVLTIIVCRAAQRAPESQGHQTSRLVLHLFLYIQCRQRLIYFTSDPLVTRILLQQLFQQLSGKKSVFLITVFFFQKHLAEHDESIWVLKFNRILLVYSQTIRKNKFNYHFND